MPNRTLVFITTCKPVVGEQVLIQEQAIQSWKLLRGIPIKIVVVGNDEGVAKLCQENEVIHEPIVQNAHGVPRLRSMLELGYKHGSDEDIFVWTNSDMIYLQDLVATVRSVVTDQSKYFLCGRRWDWNKSKVDLSNLDIRQVLKESRLHGEGGMDYIIHSKSSIIDGIPEGVLIAGNLHDGMLVSNACRDGIPTYDCTRTLTAIHQNHKMGWERDSESHKKRVENNETTTGGLRRLRRQSDMRQFTCWENGRINVRPSPRVR